MDLLNEIYKALLESHPADRPSIRNYIAWVLFRRRVHNMFYLQVHWIRRPERYDPHRAHWVS